MPKIVFLQRELEDRLGAMLLTAYLKTNGQDAEIVVDPYRHLERSRRMAPDFIGMTVLSPSLHWALGVARRIKQILPHTRIILGGPHPTFIPDVVRDDAIDMICVGEGEKPILQLMEKWDGTLESVEATPNFWVKNGDRIIKNPLLPLLTLDELSALPDCDRSHYANHRALRNSPHWRTWTSRGCPYSCSFCFNPLYNDMYRGTGALVKQRSVESVVGEMKRMKAAGAKIIDVTDDQFLLSQKWTFAFCEAYAREVGLPLIMNSVVKYIDDERARALKEAGCKSLNFGIESGVESIRMGFHNKPFTDEHIYAAADALHRQGLAFQAYNIVGTPDETLEDMYATVRMNQKIKTTYPGCSIFQPYPGSPIAAKLGFPTDAPFSYSFFQESVMGDPARRALISNVQKMFAHMVRSGSSFQTFQTLAKNLNWTRRLYNPVFYWHYGQGVRKRFGHSWPALAKYWWYARTTG
jgi:anaerobic magnesium-protoporphyrin IX monomethyl ester cyclase